MRFPRPVPIAAFIGPLVFMFCLGLTPGISFTEDLGRHLLLGRIILDSGSVQKTNLLTYTHPDFPWVNHHWLFECGTAALYPRIGFNGLIVLKAILLCASLGLALAAAWKAAARPPGAGLCFTSLLCAVVLGYRSHLRPELLSFFFVALFLWFFELIRTSRFSVLLRLLMMLTMAVWVNTHIYFMFGLGMLGAMGLERILESSSRRRFAVESGWFAGATAACFANPNGWSGFVYPFRIMSNYGVTVMENMSPWALSKLAINPMLIALPILMAITACSVVMILIRKRQISGLANIIVAVAALIASTSMARHVPFLALTALPLVARCEPWRSPVRPVLGRSAAVAVLCLNLFLIGAIVNGAYSRVFSVPIAPTPFGFDDPARYERLRKLMSEYNLAGPVLSDFDIGSLVEFNVYPMPGYVDNRPEAFPESFWRDEYFPAVSSPAVMKRLLDVRGVNIAAFSMSMGLIPLSFRPVDNPPWAPVYVDEFMAVWLRRTPENAAAISKYELTRERLARMTREVSEELAGLDSVPWWRRQVRAESILLRLYGIVAAGGADLARPHLDQLAAMYPHYRMAREAADEAARLLQPLPN